MGLAIAKRNRLKERFQFSSKDWDIEVDELSDAELARTGPEPDSSERKPGD